MNLYLILIDFYLYAKLAKKNYFHDTLLKRVHFSWLIIEKSLTLQRFRAIAVKEELLDMLRCNDKQFNFKKNGFN